MQGRRIVETGHFLQGMVFMDQDEEHDYYYDNGTYCSCAVKRIDGKREGPATIQDRTGRVIAKLVYSNDSINGNCTRNFRDYKLVCDVKDNIMHGYYWKYDKNDNIIGQGEYDHGKQKIEGDDYDNVYSSGQFDNNQYTARHETNNRNNGYQKHESQENSSHSTYSAYRQPTDQGSGLSSFLKVGATAVALGTAVVGLAKLFSSSHDDDR